MHVCILGDSWCACVQALSRNKLEHTHIQGRRNTLYMGGLKISNDLLTIPSSFSFGTYSTGTLIAFSNWGGK